MDTKYPSEFAELLATYDPDIRAAVVVVLRGLKIPDLFAKLPTHDQRAIVALFMGRSARLAALTQHGRRWPDTIAQLEPVYEDARRQMIADGLPDPGPHRPLRTIPGLTLPTKKDRRTP